MEQSPDPATPMASENISTNKIYCDFRHGYRQSTEKCAGIMKFFADLDEVQRQLVELRSGIMDSNDKSRICFYHERSLLNNFSTQFVKCCNPFNYHMKPMKARLREVTIHHHEIGKYHNIDLIPGKKICSRCQERIDLMKNEIPASSSHSENSSINRTLSSLSHLSLESNEFIPSQEQKGRLQTICEVLQLSPVKIHNYHDGGKRFYSKRKLETIFEKTEVAMKKVCRMDDVVLSNKNKSDAFDTLLSELKEKFEKSSSREEKLQILTLVVGKMKKNEIEQYFNTTYYFVSEATLLKEKYGILAYPKKYNVNKISPEVLTRIKNYYTDDALGHVRILPGKKDCVSLGGGIRESKRLILSNLRELYYAYKEEYPEDKVGLSIFCSLRPKFCVLAGSPGTHLICVCTFHQNMKLLLQAMDQKLDYKNVIERIVCDINNFSCMMRLCIRCNDKERTERIIKSVFFPEDEDFDFDMEITYSEWIQEGQSKLVQMRSTYAEYLESVIKSMDTLIPHHYIAKQQSEFLKSRKRNLKKNEALVLLDFSENYNFVTQDAVQGDYYNKRQCTVHPAVIYMKDNNNSIIIRSLCFFSEDIKHDVATVKVYQSYIVNYIKQKFSHIDYIEYYSDGCAGQYKNCNNLYFLTYHKKNYGINAAWIFFATSHGKSPCDGIGGMVKREAAKESLKKSANEQILTAQDLHEFCKKKLSSITPFLIEAEEIDKQRTDMPKNICTIPGTRSYHHFIPITEQIIACKTTSSQDDVCMRFNFSKKKEYKWTKNAFVSFVVNRVLYVGYIVSIIDLEMEVEISILEKKTKNLYQWPNAESIVSVPFSHVLCKVNVHQQKNDVIEVKFGQSHTIFKNFLITSDNEIREEEYDVTIIYSFILS